MAGSTGLQISHLPVLAAEIRIASLQGTRAQSCSTVYKTASQVSYSDNYTRVVYVSFLLWSGLGDEAANSSTSVPGSVAVGMPVGMSVGGSVGRLAVGEGTGVGVGQKYEAAWNIKL